MFPALARALPSDDLARRCVAWYFMAVVLASSRASRAFAGKFARRHRVAGLVHLCALCAVARDVVTRDRAGALDGVWYDAVMCVTGLAATVTAHADFAKTREHREAAPGRKSGTLHEQAAVTGSEMLEHAFYHLVNAFQIVYVRLTGSVWFMETSGVVRSFACIGATSIWMWRSRFPTNSFSTNYRSGTLVDLETVLYRLKKYQYVMYKTVLLHGLNVSLAIVPRTSPLATTFNWRVYWLLLNSAYVFEFFLQTLVRRKYMHQWTMLAMNQTLMVLSTAAVVPVVLDNLQISAALVAFALNFLNRKRELVNVSVALAVCALSPHSRFFPRISY